MSSRDPQGKKRDLLDAALKVFAARGLAGARVDQIAHTAGCSAGLLYTYFGSKEALFDAVMDDITVQAMDSTPIDPSDLPGYAVRAYESAASNPDVGRFASWHQLESPPHGAAREALATATQSKIALLQQAQDDGRLSTRLPAAGLLIAIQAIARMWLTLPEDVVTTADPTGSVTTRADCVRRAVEELVK
ncbi:TetR family transcriptional regulator [Rathayibacter sp. VKM Ac-2927]|uniref:TetR family transcriptional regulator n=1 Tax=Rathayibacter sp. VKM Ac-2927 TaxID=2929478 RepID=UPI001FB29B39|nr:TetR family transcriptional regulator [Rathayibacter sp. VKM Ac-2927]MCJ1688522.1 TetR family transcriptional regulator [Rathayibacter sp. VKM Ac-2927]